MRPLALTLALLALSCPASARAARRGPLPFAPGQTHQRARLDPAKGPPVRTKLKDAEVPWGVSLPGYRPRVHVDPEVLENDETKRPGGWADEADFAATQRRRTLRSYLGPVTLGPDGLPRNPIGRTGLAGRGELGRWGANFAADSILTRFHPRTGALQLLLVQRPSGVWALPGGMVDAGETATRAMEREAKEEASVAVSMRGARLAYRGYVDDPRNTDHAWMETLARHRHLDGIEASSVRPRRSNEALAARWKTITPKLIDGLYASHGSFVSTAALDVLAVQPALSPQLQRLRVALSR